MPDGGTIRSNSTAAAYAPLLDAVPPEVAGIAKVEQGLLIHEHVAGAYEVAQSDADRQTVHIRPAVSCLRASPSATTGRFTSPLLPAVLTAIALDGAVSASAETDGALSGRVGD